jgi:hypothetical protein
MMQLALASDQKKAFDKELVDNSKHVQSSTVTLKQLTVRLQELEKLAWSNFQIALMAW